MKEEDLSVILNKVEELQALLVFSQRSIPFLQDIFTFVNDMVPVLQQLRTSVETTSEKLPKASKQLDKVTTATEVASTEILNILETMFTKIQGMQTEARNRNAEIEALKASAQEIAERLHLLAIPSGNGDERAAFIGACEKHFEGVAALISSEKEIAELDTLQSDCTNIMIALQVQDITAQQIAAVNKMMQSVDTGLNRLLKHFSKVQTETEPPKYKHRRLDIVFDVSAEYQGGEERQHLADSVIEETKQAEKGKPEEGVKRGKKRRARKGNTTA